jgi:hypothetical protein
MSCDIEVPVDDFSDDDDFWLKTSELSLGAIWNNSEDDIYAELLQREFSTESETV